MRRGDLTPSLANVTNSIDHFQGSEQRSGDVPLSSAGRVDEQILTWNAVERLPKSANISQQCLSTQVALIEVQVLLAVLPERRREFFGRKRLSDATARQRLLCRCDEGAHGRAWHLDELIQESTQNSGHWSCF